MCFEEQCQLIVEESNELLVLFLLRWSQSKSLIEPCSGVESCLLLEDLHALATSGEPLRCVVPELLKCSQNFIVTLSKLKLLNDLFELIKQRLQRCLSSLVTL